MNKFKYTVCAFGFVSVINLINSILSFSDGNIDAGFGWSISTIMGILIINDAFEIKKLKENPDEQED